MIISYYDQLFKFSKINELFTDYVLFSFSFFFLYASFILIPILKVLIQLLRDILLIDKDKVLWVQSMCYVRIPNVI
jgi:hypothetical protein